MRLLKIVGKVIAGVVALIVLAGIGFTMWVKANLRDDPFFAGGRYDGTTKVESVIVGQKFCIPRNHFFQRPRPVMDAALLIFWLPDYSGWRKGRDSRQSAKNSFTVLIQPMPPKPNGTENFVKEGLIETIEAHDRTIYVRRFIHDLSFDHIFRDQNGDIHTYYSCEPYTDTPNQSCRYRIYRNGLSISGHFNYDYEHIFLDMMKKIETILWEDWRCDDPIGDSPHVEAK